MTIIIILIVIIICLLFVYMNKKEHFQYIYQDSKGDYVPVDYVRTYKRNRMLQVPIPDERTCQVLCQQTPNCNGINFAIGQCTLYRDFKYEEPTKQVIQPINPIPKTLYKCNNLTGCNN